MKQTFEGRVSGGELSPGAIVEIVSRGLVLEYAPVLKKGDFQAKLVINQEIVRRIEVIGHTKATVEAGQNVDGEPKALEAPERDHKCLTCKHLAADVFGEEESLCKSCKEHDNFVGSWVEDGAEEEVDPEIALQEADDLRDQAEGGESYA